MALSITLLQHEFSFFYTHHHLSFYSNPHLLPFFYTHHYSFILSLNYESLYHCANSAHYHLSYSRRSMCFFTLSA
jgi:hypothetical protein